MVRAVEQRDADIHDREPGKGALLHHIDHTPLDRGDVLFRHAAAHHLVDELEPLARLERLQPHDNVRVLAAAAGLLHVLLVDLGPSGNRLAVGDLRGAGLHLDPELPAQPVDKDFEVELAHARKDGLLGLGVSGHEKGRVFLGQPVQPVGQLLLVLPVGDGDGDGQHRRRELDGLEHDGVGAAADGVAGHGVGQPDNRADFPGVERLNLLLAVGVHP